MGEFVCRDPVHERRDGDRPLPVRADHLRELVGVDVDHRVAGPGCAVSPTRLSSSTNPGLNRRRIRASEAISRSAASHTTRYGSHRP